MKIYFNGWFSGFIDKTNPGLNVDFFLELFSKVYFETCSIGSVDESDILCEFDDLIQCSTALSLKKWKHTYLFSGESTLKCNKKYYTCVLWGERNYDNVVNLPLFIPYIYTNHFVKTLENITHDITHTSVPEKDVCVIISNPNGIIRNKFLNILDKSMKVDYAGHYKNNINIITSNYNTPEFLSYISNYKFIISMENSREDTYITEKVIHGLLAKTIPIYWGSNRIHDYINKERILTLENENDDDINKLIEKMKDIVNNKDKWKNIILKNVFPTSKLERNIDIISKDIRCLLENKCWNHISHIYCLNNPIFEPDRHTMLTKLFQNLNISDNYISYISPTYKHTIDDDLYNKVVKEQLVLQLRNLPMKKGEISLFLNYKSILEDICNNYKDGLFFIFESDIMVSKDTHKINNFMDFIFSKKNNFDFIHMGMFDNGIYGIPIMNGITGYRKYNEPLNDILLTYINKNSNKFIEDITNDKNEFRLIRKFHTRCTDNFLCSYKGIQTFLNYMNSETNYGAPFDYYMSNFFEKNIDIKHYWSVNEFFKQGSNIGLIQTTLQY